MSPCQSRENDDRGQGVCMNGSCFSIGRHANVANKGSGGPWVSQALCDSVFGVGEPWSSSLARGAIAVFAGRGGDAARILNELYHLQVEEEIYARTLDRLKQNAANNPSNSAPGNAREDTRAGVAGQRGLWTTNEWRGGMILVSRQCKASSVEVSQSKPSNSSSYLRHTAVISEGKFLLDLSNGPETPFTRVILRHKKCEEAGKKATVFTKRIWLDLADATTVSEGEEVTLMDWGNGYIIKIERDQNGNVTGLKGELHLEGSVKVTKLKLTWLPKTSELVPLTLVDLDHLITKKRLEETDEFINVLNSVTRVEVSAVGDSNMRNLQRGEIIQLERKGYYICDVPYLRSARPIVLISIPDGRQQKLPGQ